MNPFWLARGKKHFESYFQLREKEKKVFPYEVDNTTPVWRDSMVEHIKPNNK